METKIELARTSAGLSKRALAEMAGVSEGTIRKWEVLGTSKARAGCLLRVARALGVAVEELVDEE